MRYKSINKLTKLFGLYSSNIKMNTELDIEFNKNTYKKIKVKLVFKIYFFLLMRYMKRMKKGHVIFAVWKLFLLIIKLLITKCFSSSDSWYMSALITGKMSCKRKTHPKITTTVEGKEFCQYFHAAYAFNNQTFL